MLLKRKRLQNKVIKKKTIFVYVSQGFAVRYLLQTDIIKTLREGDAQIVILSQNADEPAFRKAFEGKNVVIEKFKQESCERYLQGSRFQRVLKNLRAFVLNGKYDTRTIDDFRAIFIAQKGWTKENGFKVYLAGLLWEAASNILKKSKFIRKFLLDLECRLFCPKFHKDLFEKYSPGEVVVTSLGWWDYDQYLMREARSCGVPVTAVILSWDNPSGMGMPGAYADHVIAWTQNMKKELIELNDIDEKKIFVGGVAHFDNYYNADLILDRDRLFGQLGLDPQKKTIFFATKSPKRFPWSAEIISELAKGIQSGKIKYASQVLVRIHPAHYRRDNGRFIFQNILDEYERVAREFACVRLNIPSMESEGMDLDLAYSEIPLVASVLKHSDVMLNMFSTMAIEAAIFGLPAINLCLRDKCRADFTKSRQDIMIDYKQTHNQRVVMAGGVKTVFNMDELFDAVNQYLDNPRLDAEGRQRIMENEAGDFRGNAGREIARHILSLAKG